MSDENRDDSPVPEDPMTSLAEGAAQMHELFMSYVHAGFSRAEALQVVIGILTASIRPPDVG